MQVANTVRSIVSLTRKTKIIYFKYGYDVLGKEKES